MSDVSACAGAFRLATVALGLASLVWAPPVLAQGQPTTGPDVTVIDVYDIDSYGGANGFHGYAVGTTSCNIGDDELNWCNTGGCGGGLLSNQHPVIDQNLYRLKSGRFTQIGMSWLKHGFFATNKGNAQTCRQGTACVAPPLGYEQLGIGCTDTYWAGLNGNQPLGRRSEVNATTSSFSYPYTNVGFSQVYDQRVKVADADVDPAANAGALYWVEGQYVSDNDAAAGNGLNNASYRKATVAAGTFDLIIEPDPPGGFATVRERSAIHAWQASDPAVELANVDLPGAIVERFEVARRVTPIAVNTWHYEYAVRNVNSDRSVRAVSIDFADGTPNSGAGFHDVDSHSGEPYSTADWIPAVTPGTGTVAWSTSAFASDPNANALRWATMYSFWFDADAPPTTATQTLELFKPGTPMSVTFTFALFSDGFEAHNLTDWSSSTP